MALYLNDMLEFIDPFHLINFISDTVLSFLVMLYTLIYYHINLKFSVADEYRTTPENLNSYAKVS